MAKHGSTVEVKRPRKPKRTPDGVRASILAERPLATPIFDSVVADLGSDPLNDKPTFDAWRKLPSGYVPSPAEIKAQLAKLRKAA